jgi:hypothetical protein
VLSLAFPLTSSFSYLHPSIYSKTRLHSPKHQYKIKVSYEQQHTLKSEFDAMFQANETSNNLLDIAKKDLRKG